MEEIKFKYVFRNEDGEEKEVTLSKHEDGLQDDDICEMFLDFMRSVGFSEENVFKYFREKIFDFQLKLMYN